MAFDGDQTIVMVAVHANGGDNVMVSSDNGVTWTLAQTGNTLGLGGVAYGNGYFVTGTYGAGGASNNVYRSTDGLTWEVATAMTIHAI